MSVAFWRHTLIQWHHNVIYPPPRVTSVSISVHGHCTLSLQRLICLFLGWFVRRGASAGTHPPQGSPPLPSSTPINHPPSATPSINHHSGSRPMVLWLPPTHAGQEPRAEGGSSSSSRSGGPMADQYNNSIGQSWSPRPSPNPPDPVPPDPVPPDPVPRPGPPRLSPPDPVP